MRPFYADHHHHHHQHHHPGYMVGNVDDQDLDLYVLYSNSKVILMKS